MLRIYQTYVNADRGYRFGEETTTTQHTILGDLYRAMVREYGRCIGRVYIDTDSGPQSVGWVFQSRQQYTDSRDTYTREVWVTYEHLH